MDSISENNKSTGLKELDESRFHFPRSIINVTKDDNINVVFIMYNETTLFPLRESDPDTVVGTAVTGAKVGGIPDGTALPENVTMNFTIREEVCYLYHEHLTMLFSECYQPPLCILGLLCSRYCGRCYNFIYYVFIQEVKEIGLLLVALLMSSI